MFSVLQLTVLATVALLGFSTTPLNAQNTDPVYKLGTPSLLGSGCRQGTTSTEVAADGQSFSILFSEFSAQTSQNENRVRKTCNLALPISATPGVSIGLYKIDYRGYAYVPQIPFAYGSLTNQYFFAGQVGPSVTKRYEAGADEPIMETSEINVQSVVWSPCGGSTNFRINSAVIGYKPKDANTEDVQVQIDSIDGTVSGTVQVYVAYKKCNETDNPHHQ